MIIAHNVARYYNNGKRYVAPGRSRQGALGLAKTDGYGRLAGGVNSPAARRIHPTIVGGQRNAVTISATGFPLGSAMIPSCQ